MLIIHLSPAEFDKSIIIGTFNILEILRELQYQKSIKLIHVQPMKFMGI